MVGRCSGTGFRRRRSLAPGPSDAAQLSALSGSVIERVVVHRDHVRARSLAGAGGTRWCRGPPRGGHRARGVCTRIASATSTRATSTRRVLMHPHAQRSARRVPAPSSASPDRPGPRRRGSGRPPRYSGESTIAPGRRPVEELQVLAVRGHERRAAPRARRTWGPRWRRRARRCARSRRPCRSGRSSPRSRRGWPGPGGSAPTISSGQRDNPLLKPWVIEASHEPAVAARRRPRRSGRPRGRGRPGRDRPPWPAGRSTCRCSPPPTMTRSAVVSATSAAVGSGRSGRSSQKGACVTSANALREDGLIRVREYGTRYRTPGQPPRVLRTIRPRGRWSNATL